MTQQFMFTTGVLIERLPRFLAQAKDHKKLTLEAKELEEIIDDIRREIFKSAQPMDINE